MAKESPKKVKQTKAVRIHPPLQLPAQALAERRARSVTQLVNDLLLKELEASGFWPTSEVAERLAEVVRQLQPADRNIMAGGT
jgi:hypothetical protein